MSGVIFLFQSWGCRDNSSSIHQQSQHGRGMSIRGHSSCSTGSRIARDPLRGANFKQASGSDHISFMGRLRQAVLTKDFDETLSMCCTGLFILTNQKQLLLQASLLWPHHQAPYSSQLRDIHGSSLAHPLPQHFQPPGTRCNTSSTSMTFKIHSY